MPGQPQPPLIVEPFGKNAAPSYIQNPIPLTTVDPGRASFDLGFPPQTMTEIFAGGTPPYGQDVNGILYTVTAHCAYTAAGQPAYYNSTISAAMTGYALGAVLGMNDGTGLWINTLSGNTTDPDGGSPTNWMPLYSRGLAIPPVPASGVFTLAPADYRKDVIVLSGSLAGNLQVVVPSGAIGQRQWLIVNSLTGGFTVTVKTASGTGVVVPAGGYAAPTGVYGDGTNVYPQVAPVNLPIDQNPTGLTIVQRTNAGYVFATYFNQNSPLEAFAAAAVYADAGDGYHRKIAPSVLAAQFSIQWLSGTVADGQVPQSAVTQHSAAILASAALTGVPTAPTAATNTATTQVATTQFANPGASIAQNGYQRLPSGLILQWGRTGTVPGLSSTGVSFPLTYPNACLVVTITAQNTGGTAQSADTVTAKNGAGFSLNNASNIGRVFDWFSIGY